jgi:hypothetical protein
VHAMEDGGGPPEANFAGGGGGARPARAVLGVGRRTAAREKENGEDREGSGAPAA